MNSSPITIKGDKALSRQLSNLGNKGAKRVLRRATRSATAVLAKAVKSEVPNDEGKLARAQGSKVFGRGLSMQGIVGADVDKLKAANGEDKNYPTNIDHLVNFGHVTPDGKFIPPNGYLQRGAAKGMPAAEAKYVATIASGIEQEAMRK